MANQWLTGTGVPSTGVGQVTDYYRDTANNLVYYRENAFTWTVVPAFTPNPDGIGTTWLHGDVPPLTGQGSDGDYFYEDTHKIVYRKEGATWVAKGSLDFIGIYGVQWGNGLGAPASTVPLNALPAGSFYLNVETSDIYFKNPSMVWVLKGQLGGGGGSSIIVEDTLTSDSHVNAASVSLVKTVSDSVPVAEQAAKAFSIQRGNHTGTQLAATISDFNTAVSAAAPVQSVHGRTGAVTAQSGDYTVAQVTNAQSTTNLSTDTALSGGADTYPNSVAVKTYVDAQTAGLLQLRGGWDASSNLFPTTGGSGAGGAVVVGDTWYVTVAGTLGSKAVVIGDGFFANIDTPAQTAANWTQFEANAGFTSENVANKSQTLSASATSYPSNDAVIAGLAAKEPTLPANVGSVKFLREDRTFQSILDVVLTGISFATNAAVVATDSILVAAGKLQKQITDLAASALTATSTRYSINAQTGTTYTVVAGDVSATGNKILKCTNAAAITVTLGTPTSLGASVGDSLNIRQGGAGGITITGTITGASTTAAINTTITLIAESPTSWMSVGG